MGKYVNQLLVEGNDDLHVISALCKQFNITENFEIIDCKGFENLLAQIGVRLKQSNITSLGIMVDADIDVQARWRKVQSIFSALQIALPNALPTTGFIKLVETNVTIGIWLMPNNATNGMLEDFMTFLIPDTDKLMPLAVNTLSMVEEQKLNNYIAVHKSKALIHTWLAWQADPGSPLGLAITKRFFTTDGDVCRKLVAWLGKTFAPENPKNSI